MNGLPPNWHTRSITDVVQALGSSASGLTEAEATRRLQAYGANRLRSAPPASALRIFVAQFRSVVILLLFGAMLLSLALGDRVETAAIAVVIALNTGLGFVIELRARRAMEALRRLGATRASVLRDGQLRVVGADVLVPGDAIELTAGQTVPADGRLLAQTDMQTNEAALTGESLPVSKVADAVLDAAAPLAERTNMVYQGTTVAAGVGRVLVTANREQHRGRSNRHADAIPF